MNYKIEQAKRFSQRKFLVTSRGKTVAEMEFYGFNYKNVKFQFGDEKWQAETSLFRNKFKLKHLDSDEPEILFKEKYLFGATFLYKGNRYQLRPNTEKSATNQARYDIEDENGLKRVVFNVGGKFTQKAEVEIVNDDLDHNSGLFLICIGYYLIRTENTSDSAHF